MSKELAVSEAKLAIMVAIDEHERTMRNMPPQNQEVIEAAWTKRQKAINAALEALAEATN